MIQALTFVVMNPFRAIAMRIKLITKRHQLRETEIFLFALRDQVQSGLVSIPHYEEKERRLKAQIRLLESVSECVRQK